MMAGFFIIQDYHISIHTMPRNRNPSGPPTQNLSFSVYGPNNQDQFLQTSYRRTKDDAYIQSLPTGEILSFTAKTKGPADSHLLWMQKFNNPMYADCDYRH